MSGEYRVVPYGHRLIRRRDRPVGQALVRRVFGLPELDSDWETILETTTEDTSQIEDVLANWGETATWES